MGVNRGIKMKWFKFNFFVSLLFAVSMQAVQAKEAVIIETGQELSDWANITMPLNKLEAHTLYVRVMSAMNTGVRLKTDKGLPAVRAIQEYVDETLLNKSVTKEELSMLIRILYTGYSLQPSLVHAGNPNNRPLKDFELDTRNIGSVLEPVQKPVIELPAPIEIRIVK
jgi:hypothetical protein